MDVELLEIRGDNKKKHENKATSESIALETKMQVIRRLDTDERQSEIGAALNLAASTIRTILKNKVKILSSATATTTSSATGITRSRSNTIEEMKNDFLYGLTTKLNAICP
ncbi:hypothetical protein TNCV_4596341 [Trichonephila clavipes]|uniref:HTH psq-type domain-containing protein n=1 Tax=Trichonephila clavipes TaxID=2585209 RepID=A0A8X6WH98_TRICX|nr:hypothetical protein TNCV_4596341 [Trichonephila clavipes]